MLLYAACTELQFHTLSNTNDTKLCNNCVPVQINTKYRRFAVQLYLEALKLLSLMFCIFYIKLYIYNTYLPAPPAKAKPDEFIPAST